LSAAHDGTGHSLEAPLKTETDEHIKNNVMLLDSVLITGFLQWAHMLLGVFKDCHTVSLMSCNCVKSARVSLDGCCQPRIDDENDTNIGGHCAEDNVVGVTNHWSTDVTQCTTILTIGFAFRKQVVMC